MRVLIFGDSITQGYYDMEAGGWVGRLTADLWRKKVRTNDIKTEFFNLGVSGNTTKELTERILSESKSRLWEDESIILIIEIGFNDTPTLNNEAISSPSQYVSELSELYKQAQIVTDKILFVGLTPVDETQASPWLYNTGTEDLVWANDRIWLFEQALREFVAEKSLAFVPVFEAFNEKSDNGEQLISDGIHPNEAGHELIYNLVKPELDKLMKN